MLHIAIQKWHWSPGQVAEWLAAEQRVKAFYFASLDCRAAEEQAGRRK